ncbi:MAG: hypothetical protein C0413_01630, partial [Clostridiales bacterium]|nr:hypothetical protein [Clostridiales bacterium]
TAAYAGEWAPNGETEWNGYTIQQISQMELDAILAEARGEELPVATASPAPTAAQQTNAPVPEETMVDTAPAMGIETILLIAIGTVAVAVAVVVIARKRKVEK